MKLLMQKGDEFSSDETATQEKTWEFNDDEQYQLVGLKIATTSTSTAISALGIIVLDKDCITTDGSPIKMQAAVVVEPF